MSLVGFNITNHPQQVAKRGAKDTVDERITPDWLFMQYHLKHSFTLDVAANAQNAKVPKFFDLETNGLRQSWFGHRVWCNPPYSDIRPWVEMAYGEMSVGCECIVMLLPANRTEQAWWQDLVEPHRDKPGSILKTEFLRRRFNFGVPGNEGGKFNSSPPFGCVVLTFDATRKD